MSRRRLKAAVLVVALAASLALAAQPASSQSDERRISGLALASPEPGAITATWDVPADAPAKYRVRYGPEGGDWRKKTVEAAEARLSGLEPGTSYRVQVRGRYSSRDWGPWSEEATIQARTDAAPENPNGRNGRSDRAPDSDKGTPGQNPGVRLDEDPAEDQTEVREVVVDLGDITGQKSPRSTATRTLHNAGDSIRYDFTLTGTRGVALEVRNLRGIATATLSDADSNDEIATADNTSTTYYVPRILISRLLDAGDYSLVVTSTELPEATVRGSSGMSGFIVYEVPETLRVEYSAAAAGMDEPHRSSGDYPDTVDTQAWLDVTPTSRVVRGSVSWRFQYKCGDSGDTCTSADEDWYRLDLEEDETYVFRAYGIEWSELQSEFTDEAGGASYLGPPYPLGEIELDLFNNTGNRIDLSHTTSTVTATRDRTKYKFIRSGHFEVSREPVRQSVTRSELAFITGSGDDGIYYLRVRSAGSDIGGYRLQYWGER